MKRCPQLLDYEAASRYPFDCCPGSARRNRRWHAAANPTPRSFFHRLNERNWHTGNARPPSRRGWPRAVSSSCGVPMAWPLRRWLDAWVWGGASSAHGSSAFASSALQGYPPSLAVVASPSFPPAVAVYLVKMAGERPDKLGRSLSQGDGRELARPLEREGLVDCIAAETGRRLLEPHQLKPWRSHLWLSPTTPQDAEC
jgi:hypothetical protein